jgi:hypothetical protein
LSGSTNEMDAICLIPICNCSHYIFDICICFLVDRVEVVAITIDSQCCCLG